MKKIVVTMLIITIPMLAQPDKLPRGKKDFGKRFEELEKIKLLEKLNLDEETAIKFFTRRNSSHNKIKELLFEKEQIIEQMESSLEEADKVRYKKLINNLINNEEKIYLEKKKFINSLKNILTEEQILQVIIFEERFRRDVRDLLLERGRKRFHEKR